MVDFRRTLPMGTPSKATPNSLRKSARKRPDEPEGAVEQARPARVSTRPAAPEWVARARALRSELEESIGTGVASAGVLAAIERAYAAYFLLQVPQAEIARVAHLCERAHEAIRRVKPAALDAAIKDCARVLHLGLSSAMRRRINVEALFPVVHAMAYEPNRSLAVTDATASLLGWTETTRAGFEQAVLSALREHPPKG